MSLHGKSDDQPAVHSMMLGTVVKVIRKPIACSEGFLWWQLTQALQRSGEGSDSQTCDDRQIILRNWIQGNSQPMLLPLPPLLGKGHLCGVVGHLPLDLHLIPAQTWGHQFGHGTGLLQSPASRLVDHVGAVNEHIA